MSKESGRLINLVEESSSLSGLNGYNDMSRASEPLKLKAK